MSGLEPENQKNLSCEDDFTDDDSDFESSSKHTAHKRTRENAQEKVVEPDVPEEEKHHDDDDIVYPDVPEEEKPMDDSDDDDDDGNPLLSAEELEAIDEEVSNWLPGGDYVRLPLLVEAVQEADQQIRVFQMDLQSNLLEAIEYPFTGSQRRMYSWFYYQVIHTPDYNANYEKFISVLKEKRDALAKRYKGLYQRKVILKIIDFFIGRVERQYAFYLDYVKRTEQFLVKLGVVEKRKDKK